jgi:hypothetical protein
MEYVITDPDRVQEFVRLFNDAKKEYDAKPDQAGIFQDLYGFIGEEISVQDPVGLVGAPTINGAFGLWGKPAGCFRWWVCERLSRWLGTRRCGQVVGR